MFVSNNRLDNPIYFGAKPEILSKARVLRKNMTDAEKMLWNYLKLKSKEGLKFRRQHPIDIFIADFYCHKSRLVVEVDGDYHNNKEQEIHDSSRSDELNSLGITIIRFTNEEVFSDIKSVLKVIEEQIERASGSPRLGS